MTRSFSARSTRLVGEEVTLDEIKIYVQDAVRALQNGDPSAAMKILEAILEGIEPVEDIEDTGRYLTARVAEPITPPIHLTARTPTPFHRCACEGSAWACSFCGENCHCRHDEDVALELELAAA